MTLPGLQSCLAVLLELLEVGGWQVGVLAGVRLSNPTLTGAACGARGVSPGQGKMGSALGVGVLLVLMLVGVFPPKVQSMEPPVAPSAMVYSENPVELGDPNLLICFVDQIFPPVLNITWLKDGDVVSQGVVETGFYPSRDNTFSKFSYLPFVPKPGDFYVCRVDHWGLTQSLSKLWQSKEPTPIPETTENVVCTLGLLLGILGIIAGTVLCFKARQGDEGSHRWGSR